MAIDPETWKVLVATVLPFVVGGVTAYFKVFIAPEPEFRARVKLTREALIQKLAAHHAALLNHARNIGDSALLRGDGRVEPDLVGEYSEETFRLFTIFHRLEVLKLSFKAGYYVLYATIAIGVAGVLGSVLSDSLRPIIVCVGSLDLALQLVTILVMRILSGKLDQYEDVA